MYKFIPGRLIHYRLPPSDSDSEEYVSEESSSDDDQDVTPQLSDAVNVRTDLSDGANVNHVHVLEPIPNDGSTESPEMSSDDDSDQSEYDMIGDFVGLIPTRSSFKDVKYMENEKKALMCTAGLWLQRPELFDGVKDAFYKAGTVMLFGRPGCGQRSLADAFAGTIPGCKVVAMKIYVHLINDRHVNAEALTQRALQDVRKVAPSPCVLLVDIENHFIPRADFSDVYEDLSQRIREIMKKMNEDQLKCAVIIKAGNAYDILNGILSSEIATHIYVESPNLQARRAIIQEYANKIECTSPDLDALSQFTDGWTYNDIDMTFTHASCLRYRPITSAKYFVVIPPEPCPDCVSESKLEEVPPRSPYGHDQAAPLLYMKYRNLCPHQKVHPSSKKTPGSFKAGPFVDVDDFDGDHFFVQKATMAMVWEAFTYNSIFYAPRPGDMRYFIEHMTTHGHYTAYRGKSWELDFQPPYTYEPLESINSVYSLKKIARMEVFRGIDQGDYAGLWDQASKLPLPDSLKLYVMSDNIE